MNNPSLNISFKSRCAQIRDAQAVYRAVRNTFDYSASSKAACEATKQTLKTGNILKFLYRKNEAIKNYREDRKFLKNPYNFYKEVLYSTTHEKNAPCYESAVLAELALRLNGITDCAKASLVSSSGKLLNHCVTFVKLPKTHSSRKIIVIDQWLQDADFLPNMLTKYKNEYRKYFKNLKENENIKLVAKAPLQLTKEQITELQKKYPNLLIKKKLFKTT